MGLKVYSLPAQDGDELLVSFGNGEEIAVSVRRERSTFVNFSCLNVRHAAVLTWSWGKPLTRVPRNDFPRQQ